MDLYAYSNIETIEKIAAKNSIDCPRLRGYRLMSEEKIQTLSEEDVKKIKYYIAEDLCTAVPFWDVNAYCYTYDSRAKAKCKKYLNEETQEVRWKNIHGWKRRTLKTAVHNEIQKQKRQINVFNKYVGRKDVLNIHARIGGGNWPNYKEDVVNQPWFLEKVDDAFDCTYCDIYAKLEILD